MTFDGVRRNGPSVFAVLPSAHSPGNHRLVAVPQTMWNPQRGIPSFLSKIDNDAMYFLPPPHGDKIPSGYLFAEGCDRLVVIPVHSEHGI
jgi:hypothetical protein